MQTPQTSVDNYATRATLELAALALIAAACLMNLFMSAGAGRTIVTLLAALAVPGAALMIRMPVSDPAQGATLVVGLSLSVEVVVTLVMVWTGWWHPVAAAATLAGVTAAVLAADLVRDVRWVP
ncbi:MAG: hypothetical protein QOJ63_2974 [Solirubrobacteraceae bacterium]|jgi:uncharacterized membrane protein|nr:hypothetical protein [Solirubrobacteraceae bacterium]